MPEPNQNTPATVPEQPEAKPPVRKGHAGGHRAGSHHRAHWHRQHVEPVAAATKRQRRRARCRCALQPRTRSRCRASRRSNRRRPGRTRNSAQRQQAVGCGHAAVAGGAGDSRPGGRRCAADDCRAARRDLWQQPECADPHLERLRGPGRGQAESSLPAKSSSRTPSTAIPSPSTSSVRRSTAIAAHG